MHLHVASSIFDSGAAASDIVSCFIGPSSNFQPFRITRDIDNIETCACFQINLWYVTCHSCKINADKVGGNLSSLTLFDRILYNETSQVSNNLKSYHITDK